MKKIILAIVGFYPLLFLIDFFQDTSWFGSYHTFIKRWSFPGLILLAIYWLIKRDEKYYYHELENLRLRQFLAEVKRWEDTPFIPPLQLMYLKHPPTSFSPYTKDFVNNTFYRVVVNDFRDRVYVLKDFNSFEPAAPPAYLSVIGLTTILRLIGYVAVPFVWLKAIIPYSNGWGDLLIPFVALALYRAAKILQAIIYHLPTNMNNRLAAEEIPPKVTWRDAFPDKDIGETIQRAYFVEMERRARYEAQMLGRVIPQNMPMWNNPNYPGYPYPSTDLPRWESEYEAVFKEKSNVSEHSNVIPLRQLK